MIGSGVPGSLELSSEILSSSDELLSIWGMTTSPILISSSLFALIIDYNAAIWSLNGGLSNGIISKLDLESLNKANAFQLLTLYLIPFIV
jgi:hypothetical protein